MMNKKHSRKIELVRRQYSGNKHTVVCGIGVVNYLYFNPKSFFLSFSRRWRKCIKV